MITSTIPEKSKPGLPLFGWANRHRRRPADSIRWTLDRNCLVADYRREVRHG